MKRKNRKKRKLDNRGAALVTVLVVTAFISIIATTMLYISAQNYQMKQTDYLNKQSFYEAERAVDTLKALLVEDVNKAYVIAYNDTMNNYLILGNDTARDAYYKQAYLKALKDIWDKRVNDAGGDMLTTVKNIVLTPKEDLDGDGTAESPIYQVEADCIYKVTGYGLIPDPADSSKNRFVIQGVQSKFTCGAFTNFLYTDICLEPPGLVFGASASEPISVEDCVIYVNWHKADYVP